MFDLTIQRIRNLSGTELSLLREDLLPLACGGNKVRIAEKLIEDARQKGSTVIVGYGNSRSNLCRVLSILCKMNGFGCVIVSPCDDCGARIETINSRIVAKCGAATVVCDGTDSVRVVIRETLQRLQQAGEVPYYINGDETGCGNEQVLMSAYEEVGRALAKERFDEIALAVGTGSTIAGLYHGLLRANSPTHLLGFTIAREKVRCMEALHRFGMDDASRFDIDDSVLLGGYGKTSRDLYDFVCTTLFTLGVFMDPTYVGKAYYGLNRYLEKNGENRKVLFIHTGSLPLAFDGVINEDCEA